MTEASKEALETLINKAVAKQSSEDWNKKKYNGKIMLHSYINRLKNGFKKPKQLTKSR